MEAKFKTFVLRIVYSRLLKWLSDFEIWRKFCLQLERKIKCYIIKHAAI